MVASVGSAVRVSEFMFQLESEPPLAPLTALVRDSVVGPVRGRGENPESGVSDPRLSVSARSRVPSAQEPDLSDVAGVPHAEECQRSRGAPRWSLRP